MAADGSGSETMLEDIQWSSDPVVLRYQTIAYGLKPDERRTFIDEKYLRLPWAKKTDHAVATVRKMSRGVLSFIE